ncbi:MAG: AAA family ATPase [Solirubrobacteraceae bacterium]
MPLTGHHGSAADAYLNALRANLVLVIAIIALTIGSATVGVAQRTATYKATADILLTPLPSGDQMYFGLQLLRESNDPTRTAQTAAALIDSPQAAQATAARLGPPYTRSRVQEDVEVQPKGQSNIVSVTATAIEPNLAARLANTFVEEALQARSETLREQARRVIATLRDSKSPDSATRIAQLEALAAGSDPTMSLSQDAQRPSAPEGRHAWLVTLLAGISGFAIASGAALLAEFANRRMRDEEEIVAAYPLPVLARIPKLGRKEREYGSLILPPHVREAFRTLQVQLDELHADPAADRSGHAACVVAITSATQDDGKTSCAIGLALAFADAGHRVLLIDLDARKPDIARRLGFDGHMGLASLIDDKARIADLVVYPPEVPNLQVLVTGVASAESLHGSKFVRRLPAILDEARTLADFVILDTSPLGVVSDALRVIPHSDELLVVSRPGRTRSDDLQLTRQLIERAHGMPSGLIVVGTGKRSNYTYGN